MNLKNVLITLASVAVVLGLISFYVVFYGNNGTYVINSTFGASGTFSSSTDLDASSTASSTLGLASSSASSTTSGGGTGSPQTFSTTSISPPIAWGEGNEKMSITGATLSGSQLTLDLQILMGQVAECVPLNMRIITDEEGDLAPPITPEFSFPDSGSCEGTPGETYSAQQVTFALPSPVVLPLILTTGGTSNILFEVNTDQSGDLIVALPPSTD
jgi:hypothetical protein